MKQIIIIGFLLSFYSSFSQDADVYYSQMKQKESKQEKNDVMLPLDSITHKYTYSAVVNVDSVKAQDLYSRAKIAITKLFNSGKDVTQVEDDNSKQIVAKGFFEPILNDGIFNREFGKVWFTITIQCKDGKFRYIITDFEHKGYISKWPSDDAGTLEKEKSKVFSKNQWQRLKQSIDVESKKIISVLKAEMSIGNNSNSDNW